MLFKALKANLNTFNPSFKILTKIPRVILEVLKRHLSMGRSATPCFFVPISSCLISSRIFADTRHRYCHRVFAPTLLNLKLPNPRFCFILLLLHFALIKFDIFLKLLSHRYNAQFSINATGGRIKTKTPCN